MPRHPPRPTRRPRCARLRRQGPGRLERPRHLRPLPMPAVSLATSNLARSRAQRAFDAHHRIAVDRPDRLHHSWRQGSARHHATADGYANLIAAASALHAAAQRSDLSRLGRTPQQLRSSITSLERDTAAASTSHPIKASELLVRPFSAHDDATSQCQWRDDRQSWRASPS